MGWKMLLNELQIVERITRNDRKRIIVTPIIDLKAQLGPSSLDVRLGSHFRIVKSQLDTHLNPLQPEEFIERDVSRYTELLTVSENPKNGGFVLHPGTFVLASTLEYIRLPNDIAARLEGRSSWARIGLLVHATAGFVDQGYSGTLTFELCNLGTMPIKLFVGLRLAQLCFYQTAESLLPYSKKPYAKYAGQIGPAPSYFYKEPEFETLRSKIRPSP
jgi:dCTP deaminase